MNKILIFIGVGVVVVLAAMGIAQGLGVFDMQKVVDNGVGIVPSGKALDLSNQGLVKIPGSVFSQTNLEELNVSRNQLTGSIQSQIGQLKNLVVLNASYNAMTGVPAEIGQLQNLQVLNLSYNQLTGLPNELGNLKNLKTLDLRGNAVSQQDLAGIRAKLSSTVQILVD